ncbi:1-phosphofructokinase [Williamsoniiplasma somnilux]|uniref:1-phosphofructokinase n=1 Tax=Williamsoniiplasma somnilux TaxID=215578 RepID=A0A2K8NYA5_9MOLU|nr:1-phosphofructokinase [Williamsoniiplasma somnilux]ATZ18536.1 1-phosphofructokinase [Williamsoniiplasma somnilux]
MLYTITLNPALDHIIETTGFNINETNYYNNDYVVIGGKGINVSVVLNNLKANVLSTGVMGEHNKNEFVKKFTELNVKNNFFTFNGKTRTNFKIKNLAAGEETELNGLGEEIPEDIVNNLLTYLDQNIEQDDIVIAAGSIPKSVSTDIYFKIGQLANQKKAIFILDTSKKQMLEGLKSHPYLIKPNIEEICEILDKPFKKYDLPEIKIMIQELKNLGAQNILLSMGSKGSLYFDKNGDIYQVGIAEGKLVNSVGSGDSMIAGFAYGVYKKMDIIKTLQYGSAAGGATAFTQWLGTKAEIENLVNKIIVKKI